MTSRTWHICAAQGHVAIIGVGSGRDLVSAYVFGARDVTGVELNPFFVDLLTDPHKLRSYAGLADLPGVRCRDEGRSWFARTGERFDVIEMSMIDTFAATGAGAFSLSENGLYTVEGWTISCRRSARRGCLPCRGGTHRWHRSRSVARLASRLPPSAIHGDSEPTGSRLPGERRQARDAYRLAATFFSR